MADDKPRVVAPDEKKPERETAPTADLRAAAAEREQASRAEAAKEPLYEVMTDTWGANPTFMRGDLVRPSMAPYDFEWAAKLGAIRLAPEYEGAKMANTVTAPSGEVAKVISEP